MITVEKLHRWLQIAALNALFASGVIFTMMVVNSFIPTETPPLIRDQYLKVVSQNNVQAVLETVTTLVVRSDYDAEISWYMRCSEEEFLDMGHKHQVRKTGVYVQRNPVLIPVTMYNKDCEYHSVFTWKPPFTLWSRSVERDVIHIKLQEDGKLFYHREQRP